MAYPFLTIYLLQGRHWPPASVGTALLVFGAGGLLSALFVGGLPRATGPHQEQDWPFIQGPAGCMQPHEPVPDGREGKGGQGWIGSLPLPAFSLPETTDPHASKGRLGLGLWSGS